MTEKEVILELSYQISQQEFEQFTICSMTKQFAQKIKRNNFISILKLIGAAVLVAYVSWMRPQMTVIYWLTALLVGLAIYSFFYYRKIFPWLLRRSAREGYRSSTYMQNPVTLRFFDNGFDEISQGSTISYRWQQFRRIVLLSELILLELEQENRSILIPRQRIGEQRYLLEELLQAVSEKYQLSLDTEY